MKANMKKRICMLLLTFVMALSLSLPVAALPVEAAARVKNISTKTTNYKKAPIIKKGTSKVTNSAPYTLVKFKAPASKKYTFTFYNINTVRKADRKRNFANGTLYISNLESGRYLFPIKVKTNYGSSFSISMGTKNFCKSYNKYNKLRNVHTYLTKRYATVNLKKGQTVYLRGYFAGATNSNISYYVNIK